jgi:hypothetical protein
VSSEFDLPPFLKLDHGDARLGGAMSKPGKTLVNNRRIQSGEFAQERECRKIRFYAMTS